MPDELVRMIGQKSGERNPPDKMYREERSTPLALVHVLKPRPRVGEPAPPPGILVGDELAAALTLSFPRFDDSKVGSKVEYKVNLVEWRTLWDYEAGDDSTEVDET